MACRVCSGYHKRWSLGAVKIRAESKCWVPSGRGRGIAVGCLLWRWQSTRASWASVSCFGMWRLWIPPSQVTAAVEDRVNSLHTGSTYLTALVVCDDHQGPWQRRWCHSWAANGGVSARWLAPNTPPHEWNCFKIGFLPDVLESKTFFKYIPGEL